MSNKISILYHKYMKEYKETGKNKYLYIRYHKILEKEKEKVICDHCGCEVNKGNLKRHQKSKKCINSTKD